MDNIVFVPGFLSTLSLRRATRRPGQTAKADRDFYPRSPCGERHMCHTTDRETACISIHALLAESDNVIVHSAHPHKSFLSTLSLRRATSPCCGWFEVIYYFYPRSPCGERRVGLSSCSARIIFLSTLSLRRATIALFDFPIVPTISIHALLAESDFRQFRWFLLVGNFYPRSPCGERRL